MSNTSQHVVYKFYGAHGSLLYVGMTSDLPRRMREHALGKPWWPQVTRTMSDTYPSRREAETAEMVAIITGRPRHNKAMNYGDLRSLIVKQERGKAYRVAAALGVGWWLFVAWTALIASLAVTVWLAGFGPVGVARCFPIWMFPAAAVAVGWDEIGTTVKRVVLA